MGSGLLLHILREKGKKVFQNLASGWEYRKAIMLLLHTTLPNHKKGYLQKTYISTDPQNVFFRNRVTYTEGERATAMSSGRVSPMLSAKLLILGCL